MTTGMLRLGELVGTSNGDSRKTFSYPEILVPGIPSRIPAALACRSTRFQRSPYSVLHPSFVAHHCASFFSRHRLFHIPLDKSLERLVHNASANLSTVLSIDPELGGVVASSDSSVARRYGSSSWSIRLRKAPFSREFNSRLSYMMPILCP